MNLKIQPANLQSLQKASRSAFSKFPGPKQIARRLMNAKLSHRNSSYIMLLCIPAIVLVISTTVPTMIFQSPQQGAYFYFARTLSLDLSSGYILGLSVLCMFVAFVLPAVDQDPYASANR